MLDCTDLMRTHSLYIEINSHPLSSMILYIKLKSLAILTKRWCCLSCWLAGLEFQAELGGAVGKWAVLHLVFSKWRLVLLGSWIIEYNAAAIAKQAKAKQRSSSQLQSDKSSVSAWHHSYPHRLSQNAQFCQPSSKNWRGFHLTMSILIPNGPCHLLVWG